MADQSLIQGARDVAQSKSLKDIGGKAFVGGVVKELERKRQQVELEKKEKEERESIVNSYLDKLGNLQNIEKLGDHNKAKITEWALKKKDEYARAADCYARTKDRGCRENMEKILNAFRNFDAQKNAFDQDKLNYLKNKSNIIEIPGKGEKYSYLFTDNGIMDVENNGDLGFSINGEYSKYKDIVGGYTINNFVHATHVLERGLKLPAAVRRDPSLPLDIVFNRSNEKNSISTNLKTTGADGIMAAALINYGFDDDYELSGGKIAGNMTFESMFKDGVLADKFYDGTLTGEVYGTKNENTGLWDLGEDGTNWFWNASNSSKLNNLISEYSTDVLENQTQLELQKYADLPLGTGGKDGRNTLNAFTNSTSIRDNIVNAWKSGDINGLRLPYGRSIAYDEEDKSYVINKIDGTELTRFKTPDNEILQQILSAHKVQEKDLAEIDFTKPIFGTEVGKVTKFGGKYINQKGKEVMQNQALPKSR